MILNELITSQSLSANQSLRIGTLGPSGTSSEYATKIFAQNYLANQGITSDVLLFNTFEESMDALQQDLLEYMIVPHAYSGINEFYMRQDINLLQLFRCDTPMYGLAVRKGFEFSAELLHSEAIVSHPAPINLIKYFLRTTATIKIVNSTSVAAQLVNEGVFNIALTNAVARDKYNLEFVCEFKHIPMSWSVFGKTK